MLVSTQKVCTIKIYSTEHFCNTKIAGIGEIFVQYKILTIQYYSPVLLGIATMHSPINVCVHVNSRDVLKR